MDNKVINNEIRKKCEEVNNIRTSLEEIMRAEEELAQQIGDAMNSISVLQKIQTVKSKIRSDNEGLDNDLQLKQREINNLRESFDELAVLETDLRAQLEKSISSLSKLQDEQESSHRNNVSTYEPSVFVKPKINREIDDLISKISTFNVGNPQTNTLLQILKDELESKINELAHAQVVSKQEKNDLIDIHQRKVAGLEAIAATKDAQIQILNSKVIALSKELSDRDLLLENKNKEISRLELKLTEIDNYKQHEVILQQKLDIALNNKNSVNMFLEHGKDDEGRSIRPAKLLEDTCTSALSYMSQQMENTQKQYELMLKESFNKHIEEKHKLTEKYRTDLADIMHILEQKEEEVQKLKEDIITITHIKDELQQQNNEWKSKSETDSKRSSELLGHSMETLASKLRDAQLQISTLTYELSILRGDKNTNTSLPDSFNTLKAENIQLERDCKLAEDKARKAHIDLIRMEESFQASISCQSKLEEETCVLKRKIVELEKQIRMDESLITGFELKANTVTIDCSAELTRTREKLADFEDNIRTLLDREKLLRKEMKDHAEEENILRKENIGLRKALDEYERPRRITEQIQKELKLSNI